MVDLTVAHYIAITFDANAAVEVVIAIETSLACFKPCAYHFNV